MSQSYPNAAGSSDTLAGGRIRISHLTGSLSNQSKELDPGEIRFGRHPESTVRYDHMTDFLVSTRHGTLSYADGKWWFSDNNSTNGTFIGSTRVFGRAPLSDGQVVVLGTPGAAGSASFRAEIKPSPMAETIAMDPPERIAQEPASEDLSRITCGKCGHVNLVASEDLGHAVCERCNGVLEAIATNSPARPSLVKPSNDVFGLDSQMGTLPSQAEHGDEAPAARPEPPRLTPKPSADSDSSDAKSSPMPPREPVFRDFPVSPPRPPLPKPAGAPVDPQVRREPTSPPKPSPFNSGPVKPTAAPEPVPEKSVLEKPPELSKPAPAIDDLFAGDEARAMPAPLPTEPPPLPPAWKSAETPSEWEPQDIQMPPLPSAAGASVAGSRDPFMPEPVASSTFDPSPLPPVIDRPQPPMTMVEKTVAASEPTRGAPPVTLDERAGWATSGPAYDDPSASYSSNQGLLATPPETPAPTSAKPDVPEEGGFFGGIIGGIKSNIHRRRERKQLQQEVAELSAQLPKLETDANQSCTTLGVELWKQSARQLSTFRAAKQLSEADAAVARAKDRQLAVDREFGERTVEFQSWLAEWQEQASRLESDLSIADAGLTAAATELARIRESITGGYAGKADLLAGQGKQLLELAGEARSDPADDLWPRLLSAVESILAKADDLKAPIPDLDSLLARRSAAKESVRSATARKDETAAMVAEHRKEREEMDAAQQAISRANDEHQSKHRAEVERIQASLPVSHGDLGRQFVETPGLLSTVNPPAGIFSVAKAAHDRLVQARQSIEQKKARLAELEAG